MGLKSLLSRSSSAGNSPNETSPCTTPRIDNTDDSSLLSIREKSELEKKLGKIEASIADLNCPSQPSDKHRFFNFISTCELLDLALCEIHSITNAGKKKNILNAFTSCFHGLDSAFTKHCETYLNGYQGTSASSLFNEMEIYSLEEDILIMAVFDFYRFLVAEKNNLSEKTEKISTNKYKNTIQQALDEYEKSTPWPALNNSFIRILYTLTIGCNYICKYKLDNKVTFGRNLDFLDQIANLGKKHQPKESALKLSPSGPSLSY